MKKPFLPLFLLTIALLLIGMMLLHKQMNIQVKRTGEDHENASATERGPKLDESLSVHDAKLRSREGTLSPSQSLKSIPRKRLEDAPAWLSDSSPTLPINTHTSLTIYKGYTFHMGGYLRSDGRYEYTFVKVMDSESAEDIEAVDLDFTVVVFGNEGDLEANNGNELLGLHTDEQFGLLIKEMSKLPGFESYSFRLESAQSGKATGASSEGPEGHFTYDLILEINDQTVDVSNHFRRGEGKPDGM